MILSNLNNLIVLVSCLKITTERPRMLLWPNNMSDESLTVESRWESPSKRPYLPLRSPIAYWSGVPCADGREGCLPSLYGSNTVPSVDSSQGNSKFSLTGICMYIEGILAVYSHKYSVFDH